MFAQIEDFHQLKILEAVAKREARIAAADEEFRLAMQAAELSKYNAINQILFKGGNNKVIKQTAS